ncbi:hypothetical protein LFYK43_16570 [Ligilactobacillus salitolerans]|uniref:DUF1056 domain-containing protein n=1 Tax=Ligilactobacillus salitolerans TaxID=1808352 RepID=A0A401IUM4_9LACO|nr:hypothetical protein LFYK43_16570 [Ligilactobacillus salitolerans]
MQKLLNLIISNISFILVVLAMCSFVYAAFLFTFKATFIVGGLCLIALAYIVSPDERG